MYFVSGDLEIHPTCHGIEIPEVGNKLGEGALICVCKSYPFMYTYDVIFACKMVSSVRA